MKFTTDRRRFLRQLAGIAVLQGLGVVGLRGMSTVANGMAASSGVAEANGVAKASGVATARLSPADVRGDIEILRRALALHPGLYRYASPDDVAGWLAGFERDFVAASDEAGRYLVLSRLLARFRCGHTYASHYNQTPEVVQRLFSRPTRLPFEFRWFGTEMVVTRVYAGVPGLVPGSRVEQLNGVSSARVLRELMTYARADGHNDAKRRSLLSQQGQDSVEYFDVFQSLLFPPKGGVHRLAVRSPAGKLQRLELPAITLQARQAQSRVPANDGTPFWQWDMRQDGIAVLTMPGWAMYSLKWKNWEPWLQERLDSLAGAKALLIDLRANEGGEEIGENLLARFAPRDLEFAAYAERVRFRQTPADLDPYLDTWDNSFRRLGEGGADLGGGYFQRPGSVSRQIISAKGPRLTLPVAALVGAVNSSATFQFSLQAQSSRLVTLIGQTTGGNLRGINGGCFFFVRLPASGLEFDLPLVGYFSPTPQPDAGITPDIAVTERWEDVMLGRDATMDAALAWARRAG